MGTITGQTLADDAAALIHDVNKIRWTDANWLDWLNDGQREAAIVKPEVSVVNTSVLLTAGVTKQTMPDDSIQLFSVVRNMGADGDTPGRAVRVISRESMDSTFPDWHTDPATGEITDYMYDPRDSKRFYVYPKAPDTAWYVELAYSSVPADLATLSDTINIDNIYSNGLINYMLYRAYSRDEVYGEANVASDKHYQLFLAGLGAKQSAEVTSNPNLTTTDFNAATQAAAAKPAS